MSTLGCFPRPEQPVCIFSPHAGQGRNASPSHCIPARLPLLLSFPGFASFSHCLNTYSLRGYLWHSRSISVLSLSNNKSMPTLPSLEKWQKFCNRHVFRRYHRTTEGEFRFALQNNLGTFPGSKWQVVLRGSVSCRYSLAAAPQRPQVTVVDWQNEAPICVDNCLVTTFDTLCIFSHPIYESLPKVFTSSINTIIAGHWSLRTF